MKLEKLLNHFEDAEKTTQKLSEKRDQEKIKRTNRLLINYIGNADKAKQDRDKKQYFREQTLNFIKQYKASKRGNEK